MSRLEEGDVLTVEMINEACSRLKDMGIKPHDINGKKYYFWIQNEEGEWIPSDDLRAREALIAQIGEWDAEGYKPPGAINPEK